MKVCSNFIYAFAAKENSHYLLKKFSRSIRMTSATSPLKNIPFKSSNNCLADHEGLKLSEPLLLKRKLSSGSVISNEIEETEKIIKISKKEKSDRPFTVSVEGNIGCGKSTFLKHFSSYPRVATFPEPLDKWTNLHGNNLLGKLYENSKRWSFLFQSYVQLTRLDIHLQKPDSDVKLIERSFHNNRFCFLESAYEDGTLPEPEFRVLCEYFDTFEKHMDIGVDLIVYLRTTPEVVFERVKKRGRAEETGMSLDYLQKVHKFYERWLIDGLPRVPHAPILILDGDVDIETLFVQCEKDLPVIFGEKPYSLLDKATKN